MRPDRLLRAAAFAVRFHKGRNGRTVLRCHVYQGNSGGSFPAYTRSVAP